MLLWMLPIWFLFCFVHFNVVIGQHLVPQCLLKYWRKGGVIVAWNSRLCNTSTTQNVGIPAYISPVKCETVAAMCEWIAAHLTCDELSVCIGRCTVALLQ